MNYEKYLPLYKDFLNGSVIRPQKKGKEFLFDFKKNQGKSYKLYVAGETVQNYLKKCEPACPQQYHSIEDALDSVHAVHDAFCLDFSSKAPEKYTKRCFKKILWEPMVYYLPMSPVPTEWKIGVCATAKGIKINQNGYLRMRVDIRLKKNDVEKKSNCSKADITYILDIPEGTYPYCELEKSIIVPKNTASVSLFFEGKLYVGELYIEHPLFGSNNENLAPDFAPNSAISDFNWTGQYFSRKEWPEFRITLNNSVIFEGEVFERCHRSSDWEIPIPLDVLKENNLLKINLISDYRGALPYKINEIAILEIPSASFSVISVSETAVVGKKAYVLIKTQKNNLHLKLSSCNALSSEKEFFFESIGLHGISLDALFPCVNATFSLCDGETTVECKVNIIIKKEEDNILTGTGDAVFIKQDEYAMNEYLSWYFANHIGNMITLRPTYRWSGTRHLNDELMKNTAQLFNDLEISYVLMPDGRENPGRPSCPPDSLINGKFYLGRQNHEHDGKMFYFNSTPLSSEDEGAYDMELEIYREEPFLTAGSLESAGSYENDSIYPHRSPNVPHDIEKAHNYTIEMLKKYKNGATRHTGPGYVFKYFIEAGYDWVGAETMYSTTEILLAFLRGATNYGNTEKMGVHHAVQWSTTPHEREDHYDRYRLALYTSYMLGATDINTEEGLYRMEEYYERYGRHSVCCQNHLKQQQDFYRYISRHTRTGTFYSNFAFLHGKYDGTNGFVPEKAWGFMNTPLTEAEESWDLLKVFYPDGVPNCNLYFRGDCPTDKPLGYNTWAPMGQIDIIPIEDKKHFYSYNVLAFLGYNLADEENLDSLYSYVQNGGTLILTMAHLSSETDYNEIRNGHHKFSKSSLSFTSEEPCFEKDTYKNHPLDICTNAENGEVLHRTDSGKPLVIKYSLNKGNVILFNTPLYPSNEAIRSVYEDVLRNEKMRINNNEPFHITPNEAVSHAVYKQPDGSFNIYFIAIDWHRKRDYLRNVILSFNGFDYNITFPFGRMVKCILKGNRAVWADCEDGEILSVGDTIKVQGLGKMNFFVAENGNIKTIPVDFSDYPIKELNT